MGIVRKTKRCVEKLISDLDENKRLYLNNPKSDFSRNRKLDFKTMIRFFLTMGGDAIQSELRSYVGGHIFPASDSAFCQQRAKIKYQAFEALFHSFNSTIKSVNTYKGYRLIACDGSALWTPIQSDDEIYDCQSGSKANVGGHLHLTAFYDLLNNFYTAVDIEPERKHNEKRALVEMAYHDNSDVNTIYIADRGFESYNVMAHIDFLNRFYLIRIKDGHPGGFAHFFERPDTETYDVSYTRLFTRQKAKHMLKKNDDYVCIRHNYSLDFFTPEHDMYKMTFRILRIRISEDNYECIVTNLPKDRFDMDTIKELYGLRWGIESSFRHLKYTMKLNNFHGRREEFVKQEIYARIIMFNICQSIISQIALSSCKRKYDYKINFRQSSLILKEYFKKSTSPPEKISDQLSKHLTPIRDNRVFPRHRTRMSLIFVQYRS